MIRAKTAILTGLIMALASTNALAFGGKHGGGFEKPAFSELDANGDGQITRDEFDLFRATKFGQMDQDGNGELSAEELAAARDRAKSDRASKMVEKLDQDGSGGLSQDELMAGKRGDRAGKMIEHLDENGDGQISETEYENAAHKRGHKKNE